MNKKIYLSKGWLIWYVAVFIFVVLSSLLWSSFKGTEVTLQLEQNQEVHWTVWRPLTTGLKSLDIGFKANLSNGMLRQDMGNWESIKNKEIAPKEYLFERPRWFDDAGEPVWLDVTLNGRHCSMKALPAKEEEFWDGYIWRGLVEEIGDPNIPQQFGGKRMILCDFVETFGRNKWSVKINRMNPNLAGEIVLIKTDAPMNWKFADHNYLYLSTFALFRPILALCLFIWGIFLVFISCDKREENA